MALPFIDFDSLSGRYGLIDASSIAALGNQAEMLMTKLSEGKAREILQFPDEFDLRASLSIIERWIVIDNLVVDLVALDSLQGGRAADSFRWEPDEALRLDRSVDLAARSKDAFVSHVRSELLEKAGDYPLTDAKRLAQELAISATLIPFETVGKVLELLSRTSNAIQEAQPRIPWASFGFGLEKQYGETLAEFYGEAAPLARSHLGVERTLFYYEVAGALGAPLVLHPDRNDEAHVINSACQDAYNAVKQTLLRTFEKPIRSELETLGLSYDISLPPLVVRMIRLAGENNASIIDAAKTIKDSPPARSFRTWLAEIQTNLMRGTMDGKLNALKSIRELSRVTSAWTEEMDVRHGVAYKKRRLELSWVPRIGALLSLLEAPSIRDPILNRKGYLTFISSWYG